MVDDKNLRRDERIDPIGIELVLGIFSTLMGATSLTLQFREMASKKNVRRTFETVDIELMKLQNTLDDLILVLQRVSQYDQDIDFSTRGMSIRDTLFNLRGRDYLRWLEINDAIKRIDHRIFSVASKLRHTTFEELRKFPYEPFDPMLIEEFDALVQNMSNLTFEEFIEKLRGAVASVNKRTSEIIRNEQ